jgi:aminopeptidase YwaD
VTRRALLLQLAVLVLCPSVVAQPLGTVAPPGAAQFFAHVSALTAPEMEGRGSGTPGGERAARYIADQLAALGLRPAGDGGSFFQSFVVSTAAAVTAGTTLERLGSSPRTLEVGRDWTPHGGSLSGDASEEVVFVGYGLSAPGQGYDDYAGTDVRGRIALALDGAPEHLADLRPSRLDKLIAARRHGASALLLAADALPSLGATGASVRVVSGTLTRAAADLLLEPSSRTTAQLRAAIAAARAPVSFATGVAARIRVSLDRVDRRAANVVGILPGTDPARAGEAVVLGAHYDHLGRAGGEVHPGADDNASGTSLVLGLARAFAAAGGTSRTLVFALFSGEEMGLLGSAHYARHPPILIDRTVAMLNFDMVGRLREGRLWVGGVETGTGLRAAVSDAAAGESLSLVLRDAPVAPSDHTSFYSAGVPVLFFFTGDHGDYHTPRDTADKINAAGMADVARVAARTVERLAGGTRPSYVKVSAPPSKRHSAGARGGAFLGVTADAVSESDGLRLSSVLPDTGAARAGLKNGDVIVRLDDQPVNSFADLRRTLEHRRPGDALSVVYLRDGLDHHASATLGERL